MSESKQLTGKALFSQRKRKAFLKHLAKTGRITQSARRAGFSDSRYLRTVYRDNEEFRRQWDEAMEAAADLLEDEATRRAVEGTSKPVFYKGAVVGYEQQYSDQLLMFLMKGTRPEKYRDSHQGAGGANVGDNIFVLPMVVPDANAWQKQAAQVMQGNGIGGMKVIDVEPEKEEAPATGQEMKRR